LQYGNTEYRLKHPMANLSAGMRQSNGIYTQKYNRYLNRPQLSALFAGEYKKQERDRRIHAAYVKHGYKMKEIADYLRVHYTTVSKTLKSEGEN
jgi:hypothetical protein